VAATNACTSRDRELLREVRSGNRWAYGELYVRHRAAACRAASSYKRADEPDDLVHEAFERILAAIRRGSGPSDEFQPYLLATIRRLACDRIGRSREKPTNAVADVVDEASEGPALDPVERHMVVRAYQSLPDRARQILWASTVEGIPPRDMAPSLGVSANAAAALAYRAREKLRQAYLQVHVHVAPRPQCEPYRSWLGGYVRDGLSRRDRDVTEVHLDTCARCAVLVNELADVNVTLRRVMREGPAHREAAARRDNGCCRPRRTEVMHN
jgi:RNA polymerase sigma factor (sigma-70 family)